jgi:hypothetical protein
LRNLLGRDGNASANAAGIVVALAEKDKVQALN